MDLVELDAHCSWGWQIHGLIIGEVFCSKWFLRASPRCYKESIEHRWEAGNLGFDVRPQVPCGAVDIGAGRSDFRTRNLKRILSRKICSFLSQNQNAAPPSPDATYCPPRVLSIIKKEIELPVKLPLYW
ncbi:uncharacterized protein H6S33_003047 [Morchella sextelata]|uniref:uncharacterized protein n=1 Tax=Morchella sextelata TaxID=1174677 RepID=UPI001D055317|nr:uncharacterized protein H6S33_003047 [Morchella sextelata]KAH0607059.1 hypothetical protein H6S33_003047 [Morchella sextelata]